MYRYDRQNKLILERWIVNIDFCYSPTLTSAILPCVHIDRYRYAYIHNLDTHTYVTHAYYDIYIIMDVYYVYIYTQYNYIYAVPGSEGSLYTYPGAPGFHAIHSGKMPLAESNLLMGHLSHGTTHHIGHIDSTRFPTSTDSVRAEKTARTPLTET